jgi:predicted protein tyrosine phosphatase
VSLRVLFVCSQNRLRSPTAEVIFATHPGVETASAGLNHNAENPMTAELVAWAQLIFVMEKRHRSKLSEKFRAQLKDQRVICLNIPDDFEYMDAKLIAILQMRVTPHLPAAQI